MGPLGVEWSPGEYWVIDTAYSVKPLNPDLDLRFFYYLVKYVGLNHLKDGTSNPSLTRSTFGSQLLPFPPRREQERIAAALAKLDDKIDVNGRIAETLEQIARALFKSWFIDFEPLRGNSTVPEDIRCHFTGELTDSGIGAAPRGWRMSTIGRELVTSLGGTPSRADSSYWGGDIPWINSGEVNRFRITAPTALITEEGLRRSATKLLPERTTVIAITGATLGQVSLTEIPTCTNQSVVGVLASDIIPSEFIYFWVRERIDDLIGRQTGGAQQHVNKGDVDALPLLVPPKEVIDVYVKTVQPMFELIRVTLFESAVLAELRDALLPKLISGAVQLAAKTDGSTDKLQPATTGP